MHTNALPEALGKHLWAQSHGGNQSALKPAGVGQKEGLRVNQAIRSDDITWIDDGTFTGAQWIKWATELQSNLNSRLFLGLFSFESHYALYKPGGFYKTHLDAFKGEKNRVLSIIIYLNHEWLKADAGELVLFTNGEDKVPLVIRPEYGTIVAFLSEEIPHEVLVTNRDRYSIAGWFCVSRTNPIRLSHH